MGHRAAPTCIATLLVMCAAALGGCASGSPLGAATQAGHDAADGWRVGVVLRLGDALPDPGTLLGDCRAALAPSREGTDAFAEVAYRQGRRARLRIALVRTGSALVVGDVVSVNVLDCRQALTPIDQKAGMSPWANPAAPRPW